MTFIRIFEPKRSKEADAIVWRLRPEARFHTAFTTVVSVKTEGADDEKNFAKDSWHQRW